MDWVSYRWHDLWAWKPLYWLRCHTWTRYHIIDIRGSDGYRWGYTDPSFRLWAACFQILVDYIEKEKPFDVIDFEGGGQGEIEKELKELYHWWKEGRKKEYEDCSAILDEYDRLQDEKFGKVSMLDQLTKEEIRSFRYKHPKWNEYMDLHQRLDRKDQEMLERLVKIREHLWT